MPHDYSRYAEHGDHAEVYKDGSRIAEFTSWVIAPVVVNDEVTGPLCALLKATGPIPTDDFRTRCDLVVYRDSRERPWRKYTGDLWRRELGEEIDYTFDIRSEHEV